jgi:hypothetical protein
MSRRLNLISSTEPDTPKHSGRLAGEGLVNALGEPAGHAGSYTSGGQKPSRQSGALAVDGNGCADQRPSPTDSLSDFIGTTPEIALDQLRIGDQIVIQTAHSAYIYLVTDPAKRLGMVVGGVFGNYAAEAFLRVSPAADNYRLRAGARALFYIRSSAGYRRVTTSVITDLILRRAVTESPY